MAFFVLGYVKIIQFTSWSTLVGEKYLIVSFVDNFVYLESVIGSWGDFSRKSIDVWELRPPWWIPSTAVFGGVDICVEE